MKVKKLAKMFLSPDSFKALFLFISFLGVCPLVVGVIEPFLKLFHIYALAAIFFDIFSEKRIFRNQGRILLVLFGLCYIGTLLTNTRLISFSGLSNFCYLLAALALVYSYGKNSLKHDHISATVLCVLITLANIVGIWMFFVKFLYFIPGRGYIGMYPGENRLAGLFGNPNVLGLVCLCAVCLCVIHFVISKNRLEKAGFVIMCCINLVTLLLANSRTQMYSLLFMGAVLLFMLVLKRRVDAKRILLACGVAILCVALSFYGFKMVQRGISRLDINYDYYVNNIGNITAGQLLSLEKPLMAIEPTVETETSTTELADETETSTTELRDETEAPATEPTNETETPPTEPTNETETPPTEPTNETETPPTEPMDVTEVPTTELASASDPTQNIQTIDRKDDVDGGLNGRLEIWVSGLQIFVAKPFFGGGLDNHNNVLQELGSSSLPVKGNLHNVYLDVLVCCGAAGFACLVAFLLLMLGNVIRFFKYNDGKTWVLGSVMLASIAAFMLDGVADSTLVASFYPTGIVFWFIASEFACLMEEEALRTGHYCEERLCKVIDKFFQRKKK